MARIQSSLHSERSIEDVYSFLNRRESHLRFIPRMMELKQTSEGVFGRVGTTLAGMLNYFGIRIPVNYEIIEIEHNSSLAMNGQMGPVSFKDGYVLSRKGNETEIRFWLELKPGGWAKILSPFMGLVGRIHAWETLRNLQRELSRTVHTAPGR